MNFVRRVLESILCFSLLLACGEERPDRLFDNPADPNYEQDQKDRGSGGESTAGEGGQDSGEASFEKASTTDQTVGTAAVTSTSTCLTSDCDSSVSGAFNFTQKYQISHELCHTYDYFKVYRQDQFYRVFVSAICPDVSSERQLYTYELTFDFLTVSNLKMVSSLCDGFFDAFNHVDTDQGADSYGVAWECRQSSTNNLRQFASVDYDGEITGKNSFANDSSERRLLVSYNELEDTYGVSHVGQFYRFSSSGNAIGGPISISASDQHRLLSYGGEWYLFHSTYNNRDRCSKISAMGNLRCNNQSISDGFYDLVEEGVSIHLDYFKNPYLQYFDGDLCSTSSKGKAVELVNSLSDGFFYEGFKVTQDIGAMLYRSKTSLVVASFVTSGTFSILAESSVDSSVGLSRAGVIVLTDGLVVSYLKDGEAYASVSAFD